MALGGSSKLFTSVVAFIWTVTVQDRYYSHFRDGEAGSAGCTESQSCPARQGQGQGAGGCGCQREDTGGLRPPALPLAAANSFMAKNGLCSQTPRVAGQNEWELLFVHGVSCLSLPRLRNIPVLPSRLTTTSGSGHLVAPFHGSREGTVVFGETHIAEPGRVWTPSVARASDARARADPFCPQQKPEAWVNVKQWTGAPWLPGKLGQPDPLPVPQADTGLCF